MSLNYNLIDTIKLLELVFKNNMFYAIIVSVIALSIIIFLNKERKTVNIMILIFNIFLVFLISYYYLNDIVRFKFNNPINNIYFYFFNSIVFLILNSIINFKTKYKKTNHIIYLIVLIGLIYSLYMTHYLSNATIVVIGNIFPMIKFGNILYIVYYLICIIKFIKIYVFDKKNIK